MSFNYAQELVRLENELFRIQNEIEEIQNVKDKKLRYAYLKEQEKDIYNEIQCLEDILHLEAKGDKNSMYGRRWT